jgi:hypothetical protein
MTKKRFPAIKIMKLAATAGMVACASLWGSPVFSQSSSACTWPSERLVMWLDSLTRICRDYKPNFSSDNTFSDGLALYKSEGDSLHSLDYVVLMRKYTATVGEYSGYYVVVADYLPTPHYSIAQSSVSLTLNRQLRRVEWGSVDLIEAHRSEITRLLDIMEQGDRMQF